MVREMELRQGEIAVDMPAPRDAGLVFIGTIRTPWSSRLLTPRQVQSVKFAASPDGKSLIIAGPDADVMRRVGDKINSKLLAERAGVPVAAFAQVADTQDAVVFGLTAPEVEKMMRQLRTELAEKREAKRGR